MARVFIPPPLRNWTNDAEVLDVDGRSVREIIENLDERFPGIKAELCCGDALKPGIAVAVGSSVASMGLMEKVDADAEVHFLPAISGGGTIRAITE